VATQPLAVPGLKLQLEEGCEEAIIRCAGQINAENSQRFQDEVRNVIPASRGHVAAITRRIVLDLSNVTHIDSTGLGALLKAWTAAQTKGCNLEILNLRQRVEKRAAITTLDVFLNRIKQLFGA
jgi:anti-sigma B factor antagonist